MAATTQKKAQRSQAGGFAGRLRQVRRGRNLTQTELAAQAGLSIDTVNKLELGRSYPHPRTVEKLAKALSVEVERLTGGV